MTRIPAVTKAKTGYRGNASSEAYNRQTEETYLDIMELFDAANEIEAALAGVEDAFQLNKRFQHLYIQKLEHQLQDMKAKLSVRNEGEAKFLQPIFATDMKHDPNSLPAERAFIDPVNDVVHLPLTSRTVSKLYVADALTQSISLPKALRVQVQPATLLGARIEENDVLHAVDGNSKTRWVRRVILPLEESPVSGVSAEFIVTLPDTIISSRDVNLMTLKIFPVNSLWVEKVEYRLDGGWKLLPGWKVDHEGKPLPQKDAGNLKLCFPETAMAEVKVTLAQHSWFEENEEKVYHFGLEEFGVFHADFQSPVGKFDIPVTLHGETETKVLRSLTPLFANGSALSDGANLANPTLSYSIYTIDENDELHYTKDAFPVITTHGRLLIRAVLHADAYTGVTPVLSGVELAYDNVY